jgi:AcrR family transcriptional regulator
METLFSLTLMRELAEQSIRMNDKREQILQGAMQVFLGHGYAGTSMDRIATTAGVSKQTIYSYFQDKEGLFTALIERVTIERTKLELGAELFDGEPKIILRQLATAFLQKRHDEEYLALLRVVIGESVRFPELAQLYTRTVIQKMHLVLGNYFKSHPELNLPDPEAIAPIFLGSLVTFLISQEILYAKQIMPIEQERLIDSLIDLILSRTKE